MSVIRHCSRRLSLGILALVFFVLLVLALTRSETVTKFRFAPEPASTINFPDVKSDICDRHGFSAHVPTPGRPRKVFDLFMVNTELDWLDIRLNTLSSHVDYFVVVESDTTFTGFPKTAYLRENWDKFSKFHDRIIYHLVPDPGPGIGKSSWDHENYLRNAMLKNTFPGLVGTDREAREGDVIVVSDIDEIPKPETWDTLRQCNFPERLTLRSHFYYYSFQWQHVGKQWQHPQATTYHGINNTILPNDLRHGIGGPSPSWFWPAAWWHRRTQEGNMWDAAWHCSSCFSTLQEMLTKMSSFSHTELNTQRNRAAETIIDRVRHGLDLFGRRFEKYKRVEDNQDLPSWVKEHPDEYGYMIDRDGANAAFTDWPPESSQQ